MLGVFSRHVAALVAVEAGRLCSGRPARDS